MKRLGKSKASFKVWLEYHDKPVLGKGGAEILGAINEEKSITKAARKLGMSYRYTWNYINKIEKILHEPIVETYKGGKLGGGGAKLTSAGFSLLKDYKNVETCFSNLMLKKGYYASIDVNKGTKKFIKKS
jgi:molybdate transport system regulatory protein